jgi:hypothetical protein
MLTSQPSHVTNPFYLGFIGDYIGNAIGPDGLSHPVWTDLRETKKLDGGTIYTKAVRS